jgi:hypothetical protein
MSASNGQAHRVNGADAPVASGAAAVSGPQEAVELALVPVQADATPNQKAAPAPLAQHEAKQQETQQHGAHTDAEAPAPANGEHLTTEYLQVSAHKLALECEVVCEFAGFVHLFTLLSALRAMLFLLSI